MKQPEDNFKHLPPKPQGYKAGDAPCPHCGQRTTVNIVENNGIIEWQFSPHLYDRGDIQSQCPIHAQFTDKCLAIQKPLQKLIRNAKTQHDLHLIEIMLDGAKEQLQNQK